MQQGTRQLWLRAFGLWVLLMCVESIHGLWRMKVLAAWIGDFPTRQVCVFTGSLLIVFVTYAFIRWIPAGRTCTLLAVGAGWLGLTLVFEVCFGHFALRRSWRISRRVLTRFTAECFRSVWSS